MADLTIQSTQSSPSVSALWEAGILELRGDSYPENSFEFFAPVLSWVERYLQETSSPLNVRLYLLYLNTSSVKVMMDVFELLEESHASERPVSVIWYYDHDNERVAELAEEFKEDCTFPFEIQPLET